MSDDEYVEDLGDWEDDEEPMSIVSDKQSDPQEHKDPAAAAAFAQPLDQPYLVLTPTDIHVRMMSKVDDTSDLLSITNWEALCLLRLFRWNSQKLLDSYFTDPQKFALEAGCFVEEEKADSSVDSDPFECPQCYDEIPLQDTFALDCGHRSCKTCWKDYLVEQVKSGPNSVFTTCNYYQCKVVVPNTVFESVLMAFAEQETLTKYKKWELRNFVEGFQGIKWCPAPNCELALEALEGGVKDVTCRCEHQFCFQCSETAHRPAPCDWSKQWILKNSSESENATWVLANTKVCPKCSTQIEKNQGCNHMTCRTCKHEFCWNCKGNWSEHGTATGGFYKCNRYEDMKSKGEVTEEERVIHKAKNDLQKYLHYFQRFDNHGKACKYAIETLAVAENRMKQLQDMKGAGLQDVQFLSNAVRAVISSRRILQWTYCVGFYLQPGREKDLFEMLQEDLEKYVEHLHELSERPLEQLMADEMRAAINNYTRVTLKFRDNLMRGIENGLTTSV